MRHTPAQQHHVAILTPFMSVCMYIGVWTAAELVDGVGGLKADAEWNLVLSLRKQQPVVFLCLLMRNRLDLDSGFVLPQSWWIEWVAWKLRRSGAMC